MPRDELEKLAAECVRRCRLIAGFSDTPPTTTRTFLSDAMRDCHAYLLEKMVRLGMRAWVDNVGNLRGLYPGDRTGTARLVIGSHLDTVPNAGAFDGILGVVLGLALIQALQEEALGFDIEVIGFSEEEGVRFGLPFIGSRAFTGTLDHSLLSLEDATGCSVVSAIEGFGLDPSRLAEVEFDPASIAYLEFHIEQGPVLESIGQPLAVVEAISGQSRATVVFGGEANHAGTTPMRFRRDALAAAAEWISVVEAHARATDGLVATVGKLEITGGAGNVIPGKVIASLDVRHVVDSTRRSAFAGVIRSGEEIASRRRLDFSHVVHLDQSTVPMDTQLVELAGHSLPRMTSGAGHDAMIVAPFIPSVMIFLRSPNGLSHHPDESVLTGDVELALKCGLDFLKALGSTLPYK